MENKRGEKKGRSKKEVKEEKGRREEREFRCFALAGKPRALSNTLTAKKATRQC